jgi:hypothetical protein
MTDFQGIIADSGRIFSYAILILYFLEFETQLLFASSFLEGHARNMAFSTAYMRAVVLYASMSPPRIIFPASQFNGLSASGSDSKARMARHAACTPHAGLHSFFNISRHTSPVRKWTFGWKTLVTNVMEGGAKG